MFNGGKPGLLDRLVIGIDSFLDIRRVAHEIPGKTRAFDCADIEHVIKHQYLSVAVYTGTDAYNRNR